MAKPMTVAAYMSSGRHFYVCECSICWVQLIRQSEVGDRSDAMEVRPSPIHGLGVFALRVFKKGEFIIEYGGEKITMKEANKRERSAEAGLRDNYMFAVDADKYVIDATFEGNISKLINHSCQPNCEVVQITLEGVTRLLFFALKIINPGKELTIDFKFPKAKHPELICNCGSRRCRRFMDA